jgi:hypothetical protein
MTKQYIFFLVIFLSGCKTNHSDIDKYFTREKIEQFERAIEVAKKYNAKDDLDTLYFPTTYQFQEYIIKNNIYVIHSFNPVDVIKLDSMFIMIIDISGDISFLPMWSNYEITLICKENQLKEIFDGFPNIKNEQDVLEKRDVSLIVKLNSVQKRYSSFDFKGDLLEVVK